MAERKELNENMENQTAGQEAAQEAAQESNIPTFTVRIYPVNSRSKLKATATINIAGAFAVRGFKVFESEKGLFVKEPQQNYVKNGTELTSSTFFPITKEAREKLYGQILTSYDLTVNHGHDADLLEDEDAAEIDDFSDEDLPFDADIPDPTDEEAPGMHMG